MAITKTTALKLVTVYPALNPSAGSTKIEGNPVIYVQETVTVDDTEDNQLPLTGMSERDIYRYVEDDGAATDVSSEDTLVQSIAAAIWS